MTNVAGSGRGGGRRRLSAVWRAATVAAMALLFGAGMPATAAAGAAPSGNFCNLSLSTGKQACFATDAELRAHRTAAADYDLIAVYNWINYNKGGGYTVFSGDHVCTAATDNPDYIVYYLDEWFYNNGISHDDTYSSISTYTSNPSRCDIQLYDGLALTGASSPFYSACTHLGTCRSVNWYDRARSFVLS